MHVTWPVLLIAGKKKKKEVDLGGAMLIPMIDRYLCTHCQAYYHRYRHISHCHAHFHAQPEKPEEAWGSSRSLRRLDESGEAGGA